MVNRRRNFFFFGRCLLLCGKRQLLLPSFWGCALALFALVGGFLLLCPEPREPPPRSVCCLTEGTLFSRRPAPRWSGRRVFRFAFTAPARRKRCAARF